ncbi:MAG: UDP-2,3-diacylglucosamine diphosphatase, partial [Pseudobdellovibrionaceae bacterium]
MEAWFVSDIHLKSVNERNGITLLRFLNSLLEQKNRPSHLFLLGDIFDLWIGNHQFFVLKFAPIVNALTQLKNAGVEVVYFEGNHDLHLKSLWKQTFEIPVYTEPRSFTLGPWTVRLEHGDYINSADKAYLRYRSVVRSPFMEAVAQIVPGFLWETIGTEASKWSRKRSQVTREEKEGELRNLIRRYAQDSIKEGGS